MKICSDKKIINIVHEEHLIYNDFFLRYIEFILEKNEVLEELTFHLYHDEDELIQFHYPKKQLEKRLTLGKEECLRYRKSSLKRILGIDYYPDVVFMDEPFQLFLNHKVNHLIIEAKSNLHICFHEIEVIEYKSLNQYIFPMKGHFLVSDTYVSINSHRWCRNSEFAFDVGKADLYPSLIDEMDVYAVADGEVIEVFDELNDCDDSTNFDEIEAMYSEHERVDGNHIMILHDHGEISIYSHLKKKSIPVEVGMKVKQGDRIGQVGSSGNSACPHLHFHMMLDGIHGQGIPVVFSNIYSYFEMDCDLSESTNIIYTKELSI